MGKIEDKNLSEVAGGAFIEGKDGLWYQVRNNSGLTAEEKDVVEKFHKLMKEKGDVIGGLGFRGPGMRKHGAGGFGFMGHHMGGHHMGGPEMKPPRNNYMPEQE